MQEKTIKVYQFEELEPKVKDKVISRFRENNDYPFLSDELEEELKTQLKAQKIHIINDFKIQYDLSYSQGSGFSFLGRFKYKNYFVKITSYSRYSHKKSVTYEITTEKGNLAKPVIYQEFQNLYETICDKIEKFGYTIIEDADSEETITEMIKSNEYLFFYNGKIANSYIAGDNHE